MKKIIIVLLVLTMGFAVIGTGCSDKKDDNSSSSTSYSSSTVSNSDSSSSDLSSDSNLDSDFKWEDGKYIVGLSDQGKRILLFPRVALCLSLILKQHPVCQVVMKITALTVMIY